MSVWNRVSSCSKVIRCKMKALVLTFALLIYSPVFGQELKSKVNCYPDAAAAYTRISRIEIDNKYGMLALIYSKKDRQVIVWNNILYYETEKPEPPNYGYSKKVLKSTLVEKFTIDNCSKDTVPQIIVTLNRSGIINEYNYCKTVDNPVHHHTLIFGKNYPRDSAQTIIPKDSR